MKRIFLMLLLGFALAMPLYADGIGIHASYNKFQDTEEGEFGIGGRVLFGGMLGVLGTFDYYFPQDQMGFERDFYEFGGNLVIQVPSNSVKPYGGVGVSMARIKLKMDPFEQSDTMYGINVLGGVRFNAGSVKPFGEVRWTSYSGDEFSDVLHGFEIKFDQRIVVSGGIYF